MAIEGLAEVKANIRSIYTRREVMSIALCRFYAAKVLQKFREDQIADKFWNNQTNTAYNAVFSGDINETDAFGFFIAHAVEYGIYLELANDRQNEALRPTVEYFRNDFIRDLKEIWA